MVHETLVLTLPNPSSAALVPTSSFWRRTSPSTRPLSLRLTRRQRERRPVHRVQATRGTAHARRGIVSANRRILDEVWDRVGGANGAELVRASSIPHLRCCGLCALLRHASEKNAVQRTSRDASGASLPTGGEKERSAIACELQPGIEGGPTRDGDHQELVGMAADHVHETA